MLKHSGSWIVTRISSDFANISSAHQIGCEDDDTDAEDVSP